MDLNVDPNRVIGKLRLQLDEANIARVTLEAGLEQVTEELSVAQAKIAQYEATAALPETAGG